MSIHQNTSEKPWIGKDVLHKHGLDCKSKDNIFMKKILRFVNVASTVQTRRSSSIAFMNVVFGLLMQREISSTSVNAVIKMQTQRPKSSSLQNSRFYKPLIKQSLGLMNDGVDAPTKVRSILSSSFSLSLVPSLPDSLFPEFYFYLATTIADGVRVFAGLTLAMA